MERITECTENVSTDTETESIASNENFTLRKRKSGTQTENATLRAGESGTQSSLTKKGLVKLQKELVKKKFDSSQEYNVQHNNPEPSLAPPPPPPPPPPKLSPQPKQYIGTNSYSLLFQFLMSIFIIDHPTSDAHVHHHGVEGQSPTSPCDCPAYLHDRESPLVISQVKKCV